MEYRAQPQALNVLSDLIALNSENPPGNERAVAEYVGQLLSRAGLDVDIVEIAAGRPNVIASARGNSIGPKIILNGHLDTKPAVHSQAGLGSWQFDPFTPTHVGTRIYGLGACDTKGGVAAQLVALVRFLEHRKRWKGSVIFQGVADEENGSIWGTQALYEKGLLEADFAIVAEPTNAIITTAQLGNCWAEIRVSGLSSHAGMPWCGKDAVRVAMMLISEIDKCLADKPRDPRFRVHPVLNIGRIEGGDHPGTVPGSCFFRCAMRPLPGQTKHDYMLLLGKVAQGVAQRTGTEIEVLTFAGGGLDPNEVKTDHAMVRMLARRSDDPNLLDETGVFFGASDAQFFGKAGTAAVVLGPGDLQQAHSPNEFVETKQVEDVCSRIERFLHAALG